MKHKRKNRIASRWIALLAALDLCTTPLVCAADEVDGKPVGGKAPGILKAIQDEVLREFMEETAKQ